MSGSIQYRVNRTWDSTTNPTAAAARFFWDWLHFINDHTGLTIVEVGTGTTSHGTSVPSEWLSWNGSDDPTTLVPIALDSNSWIVFRAVNADPLLNGGGTMPWEAKLQMTMGTAYDDPSGVNYGLDGQTHQVILRASAAGGWSGTPTWDFAAGQEASEDIRVFGYTGSQAGKDYNLDIVSDDDTIWWRGAAGDFPTDTKEDRARGGYLGMIARRNSDISYPFFAMANPLNDEINNQSIDTRVWSRHSASTEYGVWNYKYGNLVAYTYTVGHDGTRVTTHRVDPWHINAITYMNPYHYSNDIVVPRMLLLEYGSPTYYGIVGELRGLVVTPSTIGFSVVFGDGSDLLQSGAYPASYGGVGMPWPASISPVW